MTEYLISRGCRNLIFAGRRYNEEARCRGFEDACVKHGIVPEVISLQPGETPVPETGWKVMSEFFESKHPCDAVFAHNDEFALGVIRAARERGIRVPDDILVTGFDNISLSEYLSPSLTTVEQPKELIASTIAGELIKSIADPTYCGRVDIACRIVKRQSA
jgi:DNA-binding LacI/PurR family transcriptional regulator